MDRFRLAGSVLRLVAMSLLFATAQPSDAPTIVRPHVAVYGADRQQLHMAGWAADRFEVSGLAAPFVAIHFHRGLSGCDGHLGYAVAGRVDLCTSLVNAMARRAILHEMSHTWLDEHVEPTIRDHFLQARRLSSWNAASDPWPMRGFEQGAEIMAWCLGERILTAQIPDNDPAQLASAFRLLTGVAPPGPIVEAPDHVPSSHKGVVHD